MNEITTAVDDLKEIIKEEFKGNNEVKFLIAKNGNQRIEIIDLDTNETWQTLQATHKVEDNDNFDEISVAMIKQFA